MSPPSASNGQAQWALVVRRSFGIPDLVAEDDARTALIGSVEERLHENGWQSPAHQIAELMVEALLALGASGSPDEALFGAERDLVDATFAGQDPAHRLLNQGMTVADPEHLDWDVMSEPPPELVATAQQVLERIGRYVQEHPLGD